MKLTKTTWLSLLLAAVLGGGVYGYELISTRQETSQVNTAQSQQLFQLPEADVQKIVIDKPQQKLELVRTQNKTNPWQLKQPQDAPANMGTVAFLLDLLVSGKPQRSFIVTADERSQYGLDEPIAKVTFVTRNGSRQIILGQSGLDEETIYAQIKSRANERSETEVVIVSKNWQYAVERELEAWKQSNKTK